MALVKHIEIGGKPCVFMASALTPRLYRKKFGRDLIVDMKVLSDRFKTISSSDEQFSIMDLTIFENLAYIMAKQADPGLPDSIDEWLDGFETFDIYEVFPELMDLWKLNRAGIATSKKK